MSAQYQDPGLWVQHVWSRPILVRCPSCGGAAKVAPRPDQERQLHFQGTRPRLTCTSCTYSSESVRVDDSYQIGAAVDPFFGAELLLQADCVGHTLWAYNSLHLDMIDKYVDAKLRVRAEFTDLQYQTMLEKLPPWIKDAKNRGAVARSTQRMRALLLRRR